jgi:Ankyrin repeats (3 copies)
MNASVCELTKLRRFGLLFLFAVFAGLSIFVRLSSRYEDYWTLFGVHLQKQGLSNVLLTAAIGTIVISTYLNTTIKAIKVITLVFAAGFLFFSAALIISTMLEFNRRVTNGTLVEKRGDIPPLMMAAYKGDLREMERLINNGADVNARNDVNNTAIHFAAGATPIQNQKYRGSPEAVAYLIEHGADVNAQNNTKITPLMDAVINDNLESLKILIAHGADVNKVSKYNETALSMAIIRTTSAAPLEPEPFICRYRDIAIELIQHNADPNFRDFTGFTPLQAAEKYHQDGLIKELKDHGARE